MNKFKGKVYIHTNKVTGEKYVGATTQKPSLRFRDGKGYKGNKQFWEDIQKYGWNNFEHLVLPKVYTTPEELNQAELELIEKLDTVNNGYNKNTKPVDYKAIIESGRRRNTIPVVGINVETNEEREFCSMHEAARWMNENVAPHIDPTDLFKKIQDITSNIRHRNTTYGYKFRKIEG